MMILKHDNDYGDNDDNDEIDTASVVFADGQALWNVTDGVTG